MICSYVFMPVAFLMGADWADSPLVAELLGIKIFLNEFVAYQQLATYKKNRLSGLEEWDGSRKQWISVRGTCHPAGDRAGMEPAKRGHGSWPDRWVVGRQGMMVLGVQGHLWPSQLACSLTAGYRVILKEPVKPLPIYPPSWWGRSWCYRAPCTPSPASPRGRLPMPCILTPKK